MERVAIVTPHHPQLSSQECEVRGKQGKIVGRIQDECTSGGHVCGEDKHHGEEQEVWCGMTGWGTLWER